jgi:anti-sigma factor RsiW
MAGTPEHPLTDAQLADLARLADGTLPADRRAEVEAAMTASPELRRAFEAQAVAIRALRATEDVGAPARLRADVERRREARGRGAATAASGRAAKPASARGSTGRRWRITPRGLIIGSAVAATLAVVLVLPGALSGSLSVQDAAAFATERPTAGAPAGVPGTPQLLQERVGNVPFPDYAMKFGWKPVGVRHDSREGRDVTTVYYRKNGRTLAYSIVSGDELDQPDSGRVVKRDAKSYHTFRTGDRTFVTWERGGHTCVISADRGTWRELVTLADWRGKGAIPF